VELFIKYGIKKKHRDVVCNFFDLAMEELDLYLPDWRKHEDADFLCDRDYFCRLSIQKNFKLPKLLEAYKRFIKFRVETRPGKLAEEVRLICEKNSRFFFHYFDKEGHLTAMCKLKYQDP